LEVVIFIAFSFIIKLSPITQGFIAKYHRMVDLNNNEFLTLDQGASPRSRWSQGRLLSEAFSLGL
jgi:hypothetical protein